LLSIETKIPVSDHNWPVL